jgi:hypothetical protein
MAVLIDETNYGQYLKQSSQPRSGSPDGNVYFDNVNDVIEMIGVDELTTFNHTTMGGGASDANQLTNFDGFTMRGIYNFMNQERKVDETLRTFLRGSKGTYRFAGAFDLINGVKFDDTVLGDGSTDINKVRGSGLIAFAATGNGQTDIDRIYHGNLSLVDVQPGTVPQWALVAETSEATLQAATWNNYQRAGDINEVVQIYGDTSFGDASAGDFDDRTSILVIRVRSWGYVPGETTSIATQIAEFSGFSAGYGVGESLNPSNTYDIADVFGGSQVSPFTGMSLEKMASPQTESDFTTADGDFTWVLHNTLGGTAQECAAYLDALALQDSDVDVGAVVVYNGQKGRVWYNRDADGKIETVSAEGEGLAIEGLSTAEKQNVILHDNSDAAKVYPFFPEVQLGVGAPAVADPEAWYHTYYVDGAASADFDTATAVTVLDSSGAPVKGNVATDAVGNIISFAYAYDTNTDAGLVPGVDKNIVVIVEGDGGVSQAITYATITRDTVVPIPCAPATDNNA